MNRYGFIITAFIKNGFHHRHNDQFFIRGCHYLVELDEDSIVDLEQAEELQGLADLGADLVHTVQE